MKIRSTAKKSICISLIALFAVLAVSVGLMCAHAQVLTVAAETQSESIALKANLYEFADDNSSSSYGFSSVKQVKRYSNGSTSLGSLSVEGASLTKSTFNGVQAIGLNSGTSLTFTYQQNVSSQSYNGQIWNLSSEAATTIAGYSVGTIGNGAIIVLQSTDGITWRSTGAKMVGINGKAFKFYPNGQDIQNGTYYKFLSVAEIYYSYVSGSHKEYPNGWCRFWGCHGYWVTDYANSYKNLGQETTVFVCANNPTAVSFTSQATKEFKIENEKLTDEEITFLEKGTTLVDQSVSFSTITVDNLSNNCYAITYSHNDGNFTKLTSTTKTFDMPGKYCFKVRTPLGKEKETTIYLINPQKDLAYAQYFGNGLIDSSKRIYDTTKAVPVYMIGKEFTIMPHSEYLPGLYGKVYYYKDDKALKANAYSVEYEFSGLTDPYTSSLQKEGYYIFDLFSSNPSIASGEIVNYSFRLYIKDDAQYAPTVNYDLLTSTRRNVSFARKVYAVTLRTAGGGSFVYCFPHTSEYYDLAYEVAENIELLSVEKYDSYYYYKSENSNTKTQYPTKTKLFEAIGLLAKKNICTLYLEANTEYLTKAAGETALKDLTKQSIDRDTCVVINETIKKALQTTEIYANDYKFTQVADYESDIVMALDENGNQYRIPYGKTLGDVFTTTQEISITEENWHGKNTYKVIYYAENENKGELMLNISGKDMVINSNNAAVVSLVGDTVNIKNGYDKYDSQSMIIISNAKGSRDVMLLSEAAGYVFANTDMDYVISVVNRFGKLYTFNLTVLQCEERYMANENKDIWGTANKENYYILNASGNIENVGITSIADPEGADIGSTDSKRNGRLTAGAIAGISVGSVAGILLVGGVLFFVIRRKRI